MTSIVSCGKCRRSFKYLGNHLNHVCLVCSTCNRLFRSKAAMLGHICQDTVKCEICGSGMPVITNTHLSKHGFDHEEYKRRYPIGLLKSTQIVAAQSALLKKANPNYMPGVKDKQSQNNGMKNPKHLAKHRKAVNDPEGQHRRHMARRRRALDTRYSSVSERVLGDLLEVPEEFRRYWITGIGEVDLAFPELQIAIEFQGCYWHGCTDCGYTLPGNEGQRERDARKASKLSNSGWWLVVVWEHEVSNVKPRKSAQ